MIVNATTPTSASALIRTGVASSVFFPTMAPSRGPQPLARTLHQTLKAHKGTVNVATYAKGTAKYLLSGGQDRTVRLWNPSVGTEIKTYSGHGYEVLSITVYVSQSIVNIAQRRLKHVVNDSSRSSHDNGKFASSGGDRTVFLWDVTTGNTIRRISGHHGKINVVDFNEEATVLASGTKRKPEPRVIDTDSTSGSYDATVKLWDLRYRSRFLVIP